MANMDKFKELLEEEYDWPCDYMYKFIVPEEAKDQLLNIFPHGEVQTKSSSKGKYISVTIIAEMDSSESVLEYYAKVSGIKGLISI